MSVFTNF